MSAALPRCCRYCGNWTAKFVDLVGGLEYPVCAVCRWFSFGARSSCLHERGVHVLQRVQFHLRAVERGASPRFAVDVLTYKARRLRSRLDFGDWRLRCKGACCLRINGACVESTFGGKVVRRG